MSYEPVASLALDHAVALLKAIADETRLRILGILAERPHSGRELALVLSLSAPTVSHHMQRLTDVGVVSATPDGTRRLYALNAALLAALQGGSTSLDVRTSRAPATYGKVAADSADEAYRAKTLRAFFDGHRLRSVPAKRRARVIVLLELLQWFEPGRDYTEVEVNAILRRAHDDVAYLRRELVDYRYLERSAGIYRVATQPPVRDANEAQEVPAAEAAWLSALIAATVTQAGPHR